MLASALQNDFSFQLFLAALSGTSLVIACGCVINNVVDRNIDQKMKRTESRAIVTGQISPRSAVLFGSILGIAGLFVLYAYVNILTTLIGLVGLFFYLVMYGISKRRTHYGTLIGSVSGATPLVAGYTAVANRLDYAALVLFLIMVFWQMPHFYAIAIFRLKEYKAAELPVLPIAKGIKRTKFEIFLYTSLYTLAVLSLGFVVHISSLYTIIVGLTATWWLNKAVQGFDAKDDAKWARGMFFASLKVLLSLCLGLSIAALLP